jgi:hypothetical protein
MTRAGGDGDRGAPRVGVKARRPGAGREHWRRLTGAEERAPVAFLRAR